MSWYSTKVRSTEMVMHFGKHKGKSIMWIMDNDPAYIEWCVSQKSPVLVFSKQLKRKLKLKQCKQTQQLCLLHL